MTHLFALALTLVFVSCSSSTTPLLKSETPEGVRIVKNSQTYNVRGIRLQEMEARYPINQDKTVSLVNFLNEATKAGAIFVNHLRVTEFGSSETCVIFVGPEDELKAELLTQLNAQTPSAPARARPKQIRTDVISENFSRWKISETKAVCQPATGVGTSSFKPYVLIQGRIYLSSEVKNKALD